MENENEMLRRVYYGLNKGAIGGSYTGFAGFWRAVLKAMTGSRNTPRVTEDKARRFYRSLWLAQTHHTSRRPLLYREIHVNGIGMWVAMDGLYVGPKHGLNKYLYAYTGMDMASRRLDIFFTHALTAVQAVKAARQFIETFRVKPGARIFTDFGAEMVGSVFTHFCAQHSLEHYFNNPTSPNKTSILERAHRTLRGIAYRIMRAPKEELAGGLGQGKTSLNMVEALKAAVSIMNNTYSRAIGMAPTEVNEDTYALVLLYQERQRAKGLDDYLSKELRRRGSKSLLSFPLPSIPRLPIGALVRVRLQGLLTDDDNGKARPNTFAKEFASLSFSSQVYRITGFQPSNPVSYTVGSVEGSFVFPYSFTGNQLSVVALPSPTSTPNLSSAKSQNGS